LPLAISFYLVLLRYPLKLPYQYERGYCSTQHDDF